MTCRGNSGQLIWADALYFRNADSFFELLDAAEFNSIALRRSKLFRALCICLVYGYVDYALELIEEAVQRSLLDQAQQQRLQSALCLLGDRRSTPRWLSSFPGRRQLAQVARWLYERLKVRTGWVTEKERLGA